VGPNQTVGIDRNGFIWVTLTNRANSHAPHCPDEPNESLIYQYLLMSPCPKMEAQFALVDAAYCFLSRHRATLSVRNVVQMVQSLSPGAVSAADLRRMAAHAPELLVLHTVRAAQLQHRGASNAS
jgi:hypothetical protein